MTLKILKNIYIKYDTCHLLEQVERNFLKRYVPMDLIWLSKNKLIHKATHPEPAIEMHFTLGFHPLAWHNVSLPSLWLPPRVGSIKENFDVAIKSNVALAAAVLSDFGVAVTLKLHSSEFLREGTAALLSTRLAQFTGMNVFSLEGNALMVILAVNWPYFFFASWHFVYVIFDISVDFSLFQNWNASKVFRCAKFCARVI